jgi:hypothetical protein
MSGKVSYSGPWSPEAFTGRVFSGIDFSKRSLVGANFSNSVCKDCDFSDSDLSHANFTNADLYRSDFTRAIMYAAKISDANLTRAIFFESYIYGWLPNGSTNITYARLLQFSLERRRRSGVVTSEASPNVRSIIFGDEIGRTEDLCRTDYQVGIHRYTFSNLDRKELAMERSQIFNRLKWMYRGNHVGDAAMHCLYYEHYYLTRSSYRYSPLAGVEVRGDRPKTTLRTFGSYIAEIVSGYGLRPLRILRSLTVLFTLFILATISINTVSSSSGVQYHPAGSDASSTVVSGSIKTLNLVDNNSVGTLGLHIVFYYGLKSMVTPDPAGFVSHGLMMPISLVYFALSLALFALLFSSIFLRLLKE